MDAAVLFISPYLQDAQILGLMLAQTSCALIHATGLKEAAARVRGKQFSVLLTEAKLDDGTWQDALFLARSQQAELVVTDVSADARFWAEVINLGAFDILVQPFQETEVRRVLLSASSRREGTWRRTAAS